MLDHQYIKKLAADAGFDLCGLAPCRHLVENESMLRAAAAPRSSRDGAGSRTEARAARAIPRI